MDEFIRSDLKNDIKEVVHNVYKFHQFDFDVDDEEFDDLMDFVSYKIAEFFE